MADFVALDPRWLKTHPLPLPAADADKNQRGKLLIVGGSRRVPGGIGLTAHAALRAGAGKVTLATIAAAAVPLGLAFPECAVVALDEAPTGEIAASAAAALDAELSSYDAVIVGPAMTEAGAADGLLAELLRRLPGSVALVLDAAALHAAACHGDALKQRADRTIYTPHSGELAAMLATDRPAIEADPRAALEKAAARYGGALMVKGATSYIAAGTVRLAYGGGGVGLATGGSGDVLAGLIGALAARGLTPLAALAWGTWLHGEAGRQLAETVGPIGYLARELPAQIPRLMHPA